MKQIHDYIGKLNFSDSKICLAEFSTHLNIAQSHINTLRFGLQKHQSLIFNPNLGGV